MKTLLVRQDKLGDCLLATSVVTSLTEALGEGQVGVLCQPGQRTLFDRHPSLPQVQVGPYRPGLLGIIQKAFQWRREGWQAVLLPKEDSGGYALAARLAGASRRIGMTRKGHGRWLTHNLEGQLDPTLHEVRLMLRMGELALDRSLKEHPLVFPPSAEEEKEAAALVDGLGEFCILCPFTGGTSRPWPVERFRELGERIGTELGLTSLVVGGPDQVKEAEAASQFAGGINAAGAGSLGVVASLFRQASFAVSVNSGLIHLAAAQGLPVCVIETREDHATASLRWSAWMTPSRVAAPWGQGDPTVGEVWQALAALRPDKASDSL